METEHAGLAASTAFPKPGFDHPNGVQLGGLGTGRIELGRTGRITLAGITNNWQRLLSGMRGTFFGLRLAWNGGKDSRFHLLQEGGQAGFSGVMRVAYRGLHPVACADYRDPHLPVGVRLTAFSPMVPHDAARSAVPGAVFAFELANRGVEPVSASLSFSWEHVLGCGGAGETGEDLACARTGNTVRPWRGEAGAGLRFCSIVPAEPGPDRNRFGECILALRAGDCADPFVVQGWNVLDDEARVLAMLAAGRLEPGLIAYRLRDLPPEFEARQIAQGVAASPDPRLSGGKAGIEGACHPAGIVGGEIELPPGEARVLTFVLAWHTPHHHGRRHPRTDYGHFYQERFPDAASAAEHLLRAAEAELAASRELSGFVHGADLPGWLADKLVNDLTPAVANSVVTRDGTLAVLEGTQSMWGSVGTMDQRLISHPAFSLFYPDLNRTELETYAALQQPDGSIAHFSGNVHDAMRDASVRYGLTGWPDLACSFIVQCLNDYLQTGEQDFFRRMLPHALRAFEWLAAADADGDGIPEGGSSWDVEHYPGRFIATATLYLATLRAMAEVAELAGRQDLLRETDRRWERAAAAVHAMWEGDRYIKTVDPAGGLRSDDVHLGQLEGEWVARQLALAPVLPDRMARLALETLYRFNGDPNRFRMAPIQVGAGGAMCPRKMGPQAWPQYTMVFLDCTAIYLGQAGRGLASVRRFDEAVREINRCPWGTTLWHDARTGMPTLDEFGFDNYMNGPAVWWVLAALTGFTPNEPRCRIALGPAPLPGLRATRYPAVSPRYWAEVVVEPRGAEREIAFTPLRFFRGGTVAVREIRLRGRFEVAGVSAGGAPQAFGAREAGPYTDVALTRPLALGAGDRLSVTVRMGESEPVIGDR